MASAVRKLFESVGTAILSLYDEGVEGKRNVLDEEDEIVCVFWPCSGSSCAGKLSDSLFKLRTAVACDVERARDGNGRGGGDMAECSVSTAGGNFVPFRKAMVLSGSL